MTTISVDLETCFPFGQLVNSFDISFGLNQEEQYGGSDHLTESVTSTDIDSIISQNEPSTCQVLIIIIPSIVKDGNISSPSLKDVYNNPFVTLVGITLKVEEDIVESSRKSSVMAVDEEDEGIFSASIDDIYWNEIE